MRLYRYLSLVPLMLLGWLALWAQQGPKSGSSETVARPRKGAATKPEEAEQPKIPSKFGKREPGAPEESATFTTDATAVSVDVAVLDNKGHFIPKIPRGNFRILEDNVPQQVSGYSTGEAPMTVAMVIEFSNLFQQYYSETWYQTLTASYGFIQTLKPEDYLAVVAYDIRPEILSDFSTNRQDAQEAMSRLRMAAFSESNLFDALVFTADRMQDIEGRKAILLVSSGVDTFSKLTFDKTRRALQEKGVPVYAISLMQALRAVAEGRMDPLARMDFLQADNQLRTFSKETGGMAFFPRFYGEFSSIFGAVHDALRSQYVLTYSPSNAKRDGKFRKIKVELVNPETNEPLRVVDEKGKPIKYTIQAKAGYTAPREVE
jgi:Ca-activated chloride channel homolog